MKVEYFEKRFLSSEDIKRLIADYFCCDANDVVLTASGDCYYGDENICAVIEKKT